jgi:hypothetical protein
LFSIQQLLGTWLDVLFRLVVNADYAASKYRAAELEAAVQAVIHEGALSAANRDVGNKALEALQRL